MYSFGFTEREASAAANACNQQLARSAFFEPTPHWRPLPRLPKLERTLLTGWLLRPSEEVQALVLQAEHRLKASPSEAASSASSPSSSPTASLSAESAYVIGLQVRTGEADRGIGINGQPYLRQEDYQRFVTEFAAATRAARRDGHRRVACLIVSDSLAARAWLAKAIKEQDEESTECLSLSDVVELASTSSSSSGSAGKGAAQLVHTMPPQSLRADVQATATRTSFVQTYAEFFLFARVVDFAILTRASLFGTVAANVLGGLAYSSTVEVGIKPRLQSGPLGISVMNNTTMMSIKYVCGELRPTGVTNITELVEALQSGDTDSDGRSGVHPLLLSAGDTLDREEGLC